MCKLRLGVFRQGFLAFTAANGFEAVIQRAKPKRSNRQHVQPPCPRFATALPRLCPNSARLSPTLPRRSPDSPRLSPDSPVLACLYTHECQVACPRLSPRLSPRLFPDSPRLSPDSPRPFSPSVRFSACMAFLLMDFGLPCEFQWFLSISINCWLFHFARWKALEFAVAEFAE